MSISFTYQVKIKSKDFIFEAFQNDTKVSRSITGPGEGSMAPGLFVLQCCGNNREKLCVQEDTKEIKKNVFSLI